MVGPGPTRAGPGPICSPAGRGAPPGPAGLPPAGLLWAAASPFPEPSRIRAAFGPDIDADLLVTAAIEQGVGALVWRGISVAGCRDQLGAGAERLRANAASWHARAHFVKDAVANAVGPLTGSGFEPVVFKGAAL